MMKGQKGFVLVHKAARADSRLLNGWKSTIAHITRWYRLHRERAQLAALSDDALKDIGLSRADVYEESERPFWSDPMKR